MISDELQELPPKPHANPEFRAPEHFAVFRKDGLGNIQPGRFRHGKHQDGALESVRFQGCRNDDVGIDDKSEGDHLRLDFFARATLMIWSICCDVRLSVPLRRDSSPRILSTSGGHRRSRARTARASHPQFLSAIIPLFREADQGQRELVTSALTLLEVLAVPYRAGNRMLAGRSPPAVGAGASRGGARVLRWRQTPDEGEKPRCAVSGARPRRRPKIDRLRRLA